MILESSRRKLTAREPNRANDRTSGTPVVGFRGRLQRITEWEPLAVQACYSGAALARLCGVSLRHLQRHIQSAFLKTLGEWLNALRLKHGYDRLAEGCTVKETAFSLGFKQVSHFSRSFKNHFGFSPSSVPITVGLNGVNPDGDQSQIQLNLFDGRANSRKNVPPLQKPK